MKKVVTFSMVLLTNWVGLTAAEDPVYFPDAELKAAIEQALGVVDPTPTDMLALTSSFDASHRGVTDLTGLEHATNLGTLDLHQNQIGDISVLSALTLLDTLVLNNNHISDLSPLCGLTGLKVLDVHENWISDLSPLGCLVGLYEINLHDNSVSDVSPLLTLTSLGFVNLLVNPLGLESCEITIPQLEAMGCHVEYTSCSAKYLTITSTAGGSVTSPGEGTFRYSPYGDTVHLEAKADPTFRFSHWSGSLSGSWPAMWLSMDKDHEVRAHFVSLLDVLVVDDNALTDPRPGDPSAGDLQENGSKDHPFDSIQEAVEVAAGGTTVLVRPGTYHESVRLVGRNIRLTGIDPENPAAATYPAIAGTGEGPVVSFAQGEDPDCRLTGFVISQGRGLSAGGIECSNSSPTISNCLIVGNRSTEMSSSAVICRHSKAVLVHCTIADNVGGLLGGGITLQDSDVVLVNSIVWGNHPHEIVLQDNSVATVAYSDVAGGWPGVGNIAEDPLFARRGTWAHPEDTSTAVGPDDPSAVWVDGDYHLRSQAGRWDPQTQAWVQDDRTSPCIDAGDPGSPMGAEPSPNGGTVNSGAYGGTTQASQSPPVIQ